MRGSREATPAFGALLRARDYTGRDAHSSAARHPVEVDLFFLDDSRQRHPSRPGMGPLVAVGGVRVPEEAIRPLEAALDELCLDTGFPEGEEFKWSPGNELWMRDGLVGNARRDFFFRVLDLAAEHGAAAIVVIEDTDRSQADFTAPSPEDDVVRLYFERANNSLYPNGRGIVIADRPGGGGQEDEERFLARCVETLRTGTRFVQFDRIDLVLSAPSHHARLLQVADVVAGASTARVGGETQYTPAIFERILPLLRREGGRIGGVGLKIQPDFLYVNLYRWLLGDDYYRRRNEGWPLPRDSMPYASSPDVP